MRLRFAGLVTVVAAFSVVTALASACSSSGARPTAGENDLSSSSSGSSSGSTVIDAGKDTGTDSSTSTCSNGSKDGDETDVDCGGTCKPCVETKLCSKKEDCVPGLECEVAELGKPEKRCRVGTCTDAVANGGETDVNCGGTTGCERCTVGKACGAPTDCRSGKCTGASCACPDGMTIVPLAAGGAYCIDTAEVTKGQYQKFIDANVPKTSQSAACSGNIDWVPSGAWPPGALNPMNGNPLGYNLGLPVHYVDWCDAVGYCKWAKKELCGKVGGGAIAKSDANNPATAAWYNACTLQGNKAWGYGTSYVAGTCVDGSGTITQTEPGIDSNGDNGIYRVADVDGAGKVGPYKNTGCQGGQVGLYQMSGNVAEWENSCDDETTPTANCKIRGGSYAAAGDENLLRCDANREAQRLTTAADVGFRCCLY